MFGSTILDVAIGTVFTFLAVSLAASVATEAVSSVLRLRERTLAVGIKALLNDPNFTGLALALYNHAFVNPFADGLAKNAVDLVEKPDYVDATHFAAALYDLLFEPGGDPAQAIARLADPQLKQVMGTLWLRADGDLDRFRAGMASWFDAAMDRLSGWYKRRTQLFAFAAALAVAALLNVNVLYEGAAIWTRPGIIAGISAASGEAAKNGMAGLDQLEPLYLIGWSRGPAPEDPSSWLVAAASWLIVAGASLFGASFWFDLLQRLVRIRGAGARPATPRR